MNRTKRIALMSALAAIALTIFVIESQIPPVVPIPGVKLGLSNIITLVTMLLLGRREAGAVFNVHRQCVLASIQRVRRLVRIYSHVRNAQAFSGKTAVGYKRACRPCAQRRPALRRDLGLRYKLTSGLRTGACRSRHYKRRFHRTCGNVSRPRAEKNN